jgi:hypothetical protein
VRMPADNRIRARARLTSVTASHRQAFVASATGLVAELGATVGTDDPRVEAAVVDAAMALAAGVDVYVLSGVEQLPDGPRLESEALATDLARRGQTVILVEPPTTRPQPPDPVGADGAHEALEVSTTRRTRV